MENIKDFVYDAQVYKAVKKIDRAWACTGCEFIENSRACNLACEHHYCSALNGIIWVKKERVKEDNQLLKQEGYKLDNNKLQYSLIPPLALEALARNLTAGLSKYPKDNWKKVDNAEERYLDALYRHLEAHRKGEVYDSESSLDKMPHLAAVAVNAMFLLEFLLTPELTK